MRAHSRQRPTIWLLTILWLVVGCGPVASTPPAPTSAASTPPASAPALPRYSKAVSLKPGTEWRFNPLAIDLNRDGFPDLVATSRLQDSGLYIYLGNGKTFTPIERTWTDTGYSALVAGDINHDG